MCFADPNLWYKTEAAIIELIEKAERLEDRRLARKLLGELETLLEDLHSWDPSDEICWDEFWSRIARIKSQFQLVPKKHLHDQQRKQINSQKD